MADGSVQKNANQADQINHRGDGNAVVVLAIVRTYLCSLLTSRPLSQTTGDIRAWWSC